MAHCTILFVCAEGWHWIGYFDRLILTEEDNELLIEYSTHIMHGTSLSRYNF
jgi:hypothetical protein